jgi:hypothetical protein
LNKCQIQEVTNLGHVVVNSIECDCDSCKENDKNNRSHIVEYPQLTVYYNYNFTNIDAIIEKVEDVKLTPYEAVEVIYPLLDQRMNVNYYYGDGVIFGCYFKDCPVGGTVIKFLGDYGIISFTYNILDFFAHKYTKTFIPRNTEHSNGPGGEL